MSPSPLSASWLLWAEHLFLCQAPLPSCFCFNVCPPCTKTLSQNTLHLLQSAGVLNIFPDDEKVTKVESFT